MPRRLAGAGDPGPTIGRLERLSDQELARVALLFSGEFLAKEVNSLLGCSSADLGRALRTVLAHDVDEENVRTEQAASKNSPS